MQNNRTFPFTSIFKNQKWLRRSGAVLALLLLGVLFVNVQPQSLFAASIGTYDQCSNDDGDGFASGDLGCRWINGNLNKNNSTYFEGDATVQRVWLTGFAPGSTHTITFKYGTTKGGKHAYDFLTTWDWSENWITDADRCQDITGCTTASETTLDIPQDPNVPDSFEPSAPGDRMFVMRGGTLDSATTPSISSGSYAGDSETVITVTFTVGPNTGAMCTSSTSCDVAIWFGAHVSAQANWGTGNGAGSISGSPYHVSLDALDGSSIGQRDNQMQADVVTATPNGTITIVKDVQGGTHSQDFDFVLTNNSTITQNFSLDDDADGTLPNTQSFSVPPGTWEATEINIPSGWTLTGIVCVDPTNNTTVLIPTATINLASNETVTCTFTNKVTTTSANLSSFKGVARDKNVRLKWRSGSEYDLTGFNVYRSTTKNGTYVLINDAVIPAKYPGQPQSAKYVYRDFDVQPGTRYFYKLELLNKAGETLEWSDVVKVRKPPSQ